MASTSESTKKNSCSALDSDIPISKATERVLGCQIQSRSDQDINDFNQHVDTDFEALNDPLTLTQTLNKFPENVALDLSEPIRSLFADAILRNYISELMVLECIDSVAMGLNEKFAFLDYVECSIEKCIESFLDDAAANGNLPPCEGVNGDEDLSIKTALHSHLYDFCMRVHAVMMSTPLPTVEWVGMPYKAFKIQPTGLVFFKKQDPEEVRKLIFG